MAEDVQATLFAPTLYARPRFSVRASRMARDNPLGVLGALLILLLLVVGVFAPALAPHGVNEFVGNPSQSPSLSFPFGTDKFGNDMLSRVIQGARISLQVGFISVGIGTVAGTIIGAWSGLKGGVADLVIQRCVDAILAFPSLVLLLVISQVLGPSVRNVIIAITVFTVPGVARVIRSGAIVEREAMYVEAAKAVGASDRRILVRHVIPNVAPLAIVVATTLLGAAILAEASLSFLGLGVPPPNPSWGSDVSTARTSLPINVWVAFFPGLAIALTVLGFNLLGDALRDIFDPRLRSR